MSLLFHCLTALFKGVPSLVYCVPMLGWDVTKKSVRNVEILRRIDDQNGVLGVIVNVVFHGRGSGGVVVSIVISCLLCTSPCAMYLSLWC